MIVGLSFNELVLLLKLVVDADGDGVAA